MAEHPDFDALWPPRPSGQRRKPSFIERIRNAWHRNQAANAEYCTKHYIEVATMGNRPDRLVWRGGRHRTRGTLVTAPSTSVSARGAASTDVTGDSRRPGVTALAI